MTEDRADHMPENYRTPPFASASNIVPLGLHVASDGTLAFDPTDAALIADLRSMVEAFAEMYPEEEAARPTRFSKSVHHLQKQKDMMSDAVRQILRQMARGSGSSAEEYDVDAMMASAFSRFPQFEDFLVLTAGCGDATVDPEHPDFALSEELAFKFTGDQA